MPSADLVPLVSETPAFSPPASLRVNGGVVHTRIWATPAIREVGVFRRPGSPADGPTHGPSVLFLCPFDLSRYRGTAIRAQITIETLRTAVRCGLICRGGGGEGSVVLDAAWQGGTRLAANLRPLKFSQMATPYVLRDAPSVVHTFDVISALPAILRWKPKLGLGVVIELHGLLSAEMGRGGAVARALVRCLERFVLRRADRIIAMSYSQMDYLVNVFKLPEEKIQVIWGPVDLGVFQYRDPEDTRTFRVGYSGNDFQWQGVDDCLTAAGLLANEREVEFAFVTGSGWQTEFRGLERVVRVVASTREETAGWLGSCHVLLSPRKGKAADLQYPFKLSSYLAAGRPVIATDVSDQRRIIEEARCGVVVPPGSPQAVAEAVLHLKGEAPEVRLEMGKRARRFAEDHLSLEQFHNALVSMYRELGI